jgi:hypothetical protein
MDRVVSVGCPMVVGCHVVRRLPHPSIQRNSRRFMLGPASDRSILTQLRHRRALANCSGRAEYFRFARPDIYALMSHKIAIGDSDLINVRFGHYADSRRTSREVREVPPTDLAPSNNLGC